MSELKKIKPPCPITNIIDREFWQGEKNLIADADFLSAFTVAELGKFLPDNLYTEKNNGEYLALDHFRPSQRIPLISHQNEAEARALALIHLLENKIIQI